MEPSNEFVAVEFEVIIKCNYSPAELAALAIHADKLSEYYLILNPATGESTA